MDPLQFHPFQRAQKGEALKGRQELSGSVLCEVKPRRSLELSGSKNVAIQYKNYLCGSVSVGDGAITASVHQTANRRVHKNTTYSTHHEPQKTPQHLQLTLKACKICKSFCEDSSQSSQPWKCSKNEWTWHFVAWFGGQGGVQRLILEVLSNLHDPMIDGSMIGLIGPNN